MEFDRYVVTSDDNRIAYEFLSEGPRGTIKKVVLYQELEQGIYNLAFGDWDEKAYKIIDHTKTNNNDRNKILATVAATVIDFMKHYPQQ